MVNWQENFLKFPEFDEYARVHIQVKPIPATITLLDASAMRKLLRKNRKKSEASQANFFYASLKEMHEEVCAELNKVGDAPTKLGNLKSKEADAISNMTPAC